MPVRDAPEADNRRDGEAIVKTKVDPTAENEVQLTVEITAEAVRKAYDRLGGDLDGQLDLVLGCGLDLRLHYRFSVSAIFGFRCVSRRHPLCGPCGGQAEACGAGERT